jgi:hypothetical protein
MNEQWCIHGWRSYRKVKCLTPKDSAMPLAAVLRAHQQAIPAYRYHSSTYTAVRLQARIDSHRADGGIFDIPSTSGNPCHTIPLPVLPQSSPFGTCRKASRLGTKAIIETYPTRMMLLSFSGRER